MFNMLTRNKTRISLFAAIFILLAVPIGASADIRLVLEYPYNVLPSTVSLDVYAGAPTTSAGSSGMSESSFTAATMTRLTPEVANGNTWILNQPGTYCYYVRPRTPNPATETQDYGRVYSVMKVIWIDPTEWPQGASTYKDGVITKTLTMPILTGPMAKTGFEPSWNPFLDHMPPWLVTRGNNQDSRDNVLGMYSDELENSVYSEKLFAHFPEGGYKTPAFTIRPRGLYQTTTHSELMAFTQEIANNSPLAHWFSLGKTPFYNFDIPIVIVTKEPIPEGATFEQAAKIIRESNKLNFWHNAQIHANENGSGEAAMAVLLDMVGAYGDKLLDRINYICIPMYNIDGSYLFQRHNAENNIDMNRDHMRLLTYETTLIHRGYLEILPHVAVDGHEYDHYSSIARSTQIAGTSNPAMYRYNNNSYSRTDVESTPASSLNNPSIEVNDLAFDLFATNYVNDLHSEGVSFAHYGETANNGIGRAWMGLMGSITFVCEGRGLGGGTHSYARRVHSYVTGTKSLINTAYENSVLVKEAVDKGRRDIIDKGRVFDSADVIALTFGSSSAATATYPNKNQAPYTTVVPTYDMSGQMVSLTTNSTQSRANNITRSRPRPTAYVFPKEDSMNVRSTDVNIATVSAANGYAINYNFLFRLMDSQDIYFYEVPAGTTATLKQYYRDSTSNTTTSNVNAGLRAEAEVTFPDGAYVVPLDQVSGAVIAMLFEPDVAGSGGYNGTVNQSLSGEAMALIFHDFTTRDFPYYRLEMDNPRQVLQDPSLIVASLTLNSNDVTLQVGDTATLTATVLPDTALDKGVTWSSSNTAAATVNSSGVVTGVAVGTAIITATASSDSTITDICAVTVNPIPVTSVAISPKPASILIGGSVTLSVDVLPATATDKTVTWSSSNTAVATVNSSGVVTGVAVGTATITARSNSNSTVTDTCVATVSPVPVAGVTVAPSSVSLFEGVAEQLTPTISPVDATNKSVTWRSNNPSVATVSDTGLVTAVSAGSAAITVRTVDGSYSDICNVTVIAPVTGVSVNPTATTISAGNIRSITHTITPSNATDQSVAWSSNNTAVATVSSSGVVTAVGAGTATITVTTNDGGFTASCNVTVITTVSVDSVAVTPKTATLAEGDTQQLTETISPSTATIKTVTWSTSDSAVATVSGAGLVTAIGAGAATITVTAADDSTKTDTCVVTVTAVPPASVPVTGVKVSPTTAALKIGNTLPLNEEVEPADATNKNVSWGSSNPSVASVASTGLVTALTEGATTITVTTEDGNKEAQCAITVYPTVETVDPVYPSNVDDVADSTGIDPNELEAKDGKVYLKKGVAETIAKALLHVNDVNTDILPVFEGTVTPDGQTAKLSFMIEGKDLLASYPEDINLIGLISGGATGLFFDYTNNASDNSDGKFTLLAGGVVFTGEIDPDATYELAAFIKDGGKFDLDGLENGKLISSIFLASEKTGKSGGSGCSAYGYLAFALFAVPFVLKRKI